MEKKDGETYYPMETEGWRNMMKKNFGKKNWMFPMPVLMIGTYNEYGTPNMMNAAWGGVTLEDEITICIDTAHKTWARSARHLPTS